jgi:hypothetical protein
MHSAEDASRILVNCVVCYVRNCFTTTLFRLIRIPMEWLGNTLLAHHPLRVKQLAD